MTPIADMVERMLAWGLAPDAIVLAIQTAERHAQRHEERHAQRLSDAPGAIRSRRWREKRKQVQQPAKANDVAGQTTNERHAQRHDVTPHSDLTSLPFLLTEETTKKETKKKKEDRTVVVDGRRRRGSRITEDWQPRDEDREFVRGLGLDPQALRDEFVDYWIAVPGSRGFKLNWYSTYRNRGREVAGRKGKYNGRDGRNNVIDAQDRLNAKLAEFSQTDMLGRVRGTEGPPDVRLLPSNRGSGS